MTPEHHLYRIFCQVNIVFAQLCSGCVANCSADPFPLPATFSTSLRSNKDTPRPGSPSQPEATDRIAWQPETGLPDDRDYPWGGDSPIHRHQSVTQLEAGLKAGGFLSKLAKRAVEKIGT
jgi:hypothetical protein